MEATVFQEDTHIPGLEFHKAFHYLKKKIPFFCLTLIQLYLVFFLPKQWE